VSRGVPSDVKKWGKDEKRREIEEITQIGQQRNSESKADAGRALKLERGRRRERRATRRSNADRRRVGIMADETHSDEW
jgi:hypothetical protein